MKLSPEEAWAGTLESMVDSRVVFYLKDIIEIIKTIPGK